jgi:uncharacterized protein YdeI (BOF family)
MKMIKNALIVTTMALLSAQAFASDSFQGWRVVQTADASSKTAAYELALDKLEQLKQDSSVELNNDLGHVTAYSSSVSLNEDAYVTVVEKMDKNGDMKYTGNVNVSVSYLR